MHSRLGFISEEGFFSEVERQRKLGFKRITLKTGAHSLQELAMTIQWGSKAKIDLFTIDGAPIGTGMSPWRMTVEWGIPSLCLHSSTQDFRTRLAEYGERPPGLAFAVGFSSEDGIFKALPVGSPYVRAVCMGRAMTIPGMGGKNIGEWIQKNDLPETVSQYGSTVQKIFVNFKTVKKIIGNRNIG